MRPIHAILALMLISGACLGEDLILKTRVEPVDVQIFIPEEAKPVQGLLVHVFNYSIKDDDRWATFCRKHKWAHINTVISRKANNRPTKIRNAINESLKEFAVKSGRPELVHVPRAGTGFSAGGMAIPVLAAQPELMLTNAISCSWVSDPAKLADAAGIPNLYIIGAKPDGFKMLPAIERHYEPAIERQLPWALGLQHECKHDWANSGTLCASWIQALLKLRYPETVDVSKPIPLRTVKFEEGWRGDRRTINSTFPTVLPAAKFKGDSKSTVWLPDRATAYVWRAWQVKDSPVDLTARTVDGSATLPRFKPRSSFDLKIRNRADIELGVNVKTDIEISDVRFFHGDVLIGEAKSEPWKFTWKSPGLGLYPVWAEYKVEGKPAATNPSLFRIDPE